MISGIGEILERETELGELARLVESPGEGVERVALISGSPGVGKTTLLSAASQMAEDAGVSCLRARGTPLEASLHLGVVRQLVEPYVRRIGFDERAQLFSGSAELLGDLVERPARTEPDAPMAPWFLLADGFHWLVANLAELCPVVLVVDDAHWADPVSRSVLAYLGPRLEQLPVSLLLAERDDPAPEDDALAALRLDSATKRLRLSNLSESATAEMMRAKLGPAADDRVARSCYEATAGNPLYLSELARALEERREFENVPRVARESLTALLGPRLATYSDATRRLAIAAAILGSPTQLHTAARVAGMDTSAAAAASDALVAANLLASIQPLEFRHPVIERAILDTIPPGRQALLRAEAARALIEAGADAEQVAAQIMLTPGRGEQSAVHALCDAADAAWRRGAPEASVRYLKRALEEPPQPNDRFRVYLELGKAEAILERPDSAAYLNRALDLAADSTQRTAAITYIASCYYFAGRMDDGVRLLEHELASNDGLDAVEIALLETELLAGAQSSLAAHRRVADRARTLAESALRGELDAEVERVLIDQLVRELLLTRGTAADVMSLVPKMGRVADRFVVATLLDLMDADTIKKVLDDPVAMWESPTGPTTAAFVHGIVAITQCRQGDLAAAERTADLALLVARSALGQGTQQLAAGMLGLAKLERGATDEAAIVLESMPDDSSAADSIFVLALWYAKARLEADKDRAENSVELLLRIGEWESEYGLENPCWIPWREAATRQLVRLGRRKQALALAHEDLDYARRFGAMRPIGIAQRAVGLATGGRRGIDHLRESLAALDRTPVQLERARTLVDLGSALRRLGASDAIEVLREGMHAADECLATPLTERARDELRAAGLRPRRPRSSGPRGLTDAETRVAALAARGASNREMAEALVVTPKTVSFHLTNIYRKLGVTSRTTLRSALEKGEDDLGEHHT